MVATGHLDSRSIPGADHMTEAAQSLRRSGTTLSFLLDIMAAVLLDESYSRHRMFSVDAVDFSALIVVVMSTRDGSTGICGAVVE